METGVHHNHFTAKHFSRPNEFSEGCFQLLITKLLFIVSHLIGGSPPLFSHHFNVIIALIKERSSLYFLFFYFSFILF